MSEVYHVWVQRRWLDLDAQGHANNTRVVDYEQEGFTKYLMSVLPGMIEGGVIVVSNRVEYLRPIMFGLTPLRADVMVSELGFAQFTLDYVIWDGDTPAARAAMTLCPFNFAASAPRWLTKEERAVLTRNLAGSDAASLGFTPLREVPVEPLNGRGLPYAVWTRWSDLDRYGHVNNVCLYDYAQEARIAVMSQIDPGMARLGSHIWDGTSNGEVRPRMWLLARQDAAYLGQVSHRLEPYLMRTACMRVGTTSMTLVAELIDQAADDAVLARVVSVVVCADSTGTPTPLPQSMRDALASTSA